MAPKKSRARVMHLMPLSLNVGGANWLFLQGDSPVQPGEDFFDSGFSGSHQGKIGKLIEDQEAFRSSVYGDAPRTAQSYGSVPPGWYFEAF